MPKKAPGGAATLKAVLSNQTSMSDLSDDQLAHLGGSRDPIDDEDFKDADFGNEVTPSQGDDEPSDEDTEETPPKKAAKEEAPDEESDEETDEESADSEGDEADTEEDAEDDPKDGQDEEDEPEEGQSDDDDEAADDATDDGEEAGDTDTDGDSADSSEDSEETGEDTEEEDDAKDKQRVPLKRFRDVNKRMRDAEAEVARLKAEAAAGNGRDPEDEEVAYDFDKAEAEYQDLVLDGKKAEAIVKRREIRAAERAEFQKDAHNVGEQHAEASHTKRALATLAVKYENLYPEMNLEHEDFNPEINLEVEAAMLGYIQQGLGETQAFDKALKKAVKLFDLKPREAALGKGKTPKGKTPKGKTPDPAKTKKKVDAGKAKAKKAKGAPPDTTRVGDPGDGGKGTPGKIDYENMSEEEFNALPKSTIARLRGDTL